MHDDPEDALLTIPDVRAKLRLGVTTIYKLIAEGRLQAVKIGAATRVRASSIKRLLDECALRPAGR